MGETLQATCTQRSVCSCSPRFLPLCPSLQQTRQRTRSSQRWRRCQPTRPRLQLQLQLTIQPIRIPPPVPEFTTLMNLVPEIPPLAQAPVFHQLQLQLQPLQLVPELTQMATTLPQLQPQLQHHRQARLVKTTPALTGQHGLTRMDQSTTVTGINRTRQTAMLTEMASKTVDTMQTRRAVLVAAALLVMMMTALALVPVRERSAMRSCFWQSRQPPPSFMRPWHIATAREKTFCSNRQTITRQARLKLGDLTKHGPSSS